MSQRVSKWQKAYAAAFVMSTAWIDVSQLARHTKVIAVADVVESVRLMELDEQDFIQRWHAFVHYAKQVLPQESGRLHKSLGDGLMMEFAEPAGCIRASLALLAWFAASNEALPPEQHVQLRVGAHIAAFVADEHDIYGNDVNLTARIATLAGPGEIVVSAALRDGLPPELREQLEDLGACHLKHVRQPVHAYRVGHAGLAPVLPAAAAPGRLLMRATLAVFPFVNAKGSEGVGESVADEAVAALTQVPELQVVSRLSTTVLPMERANYVLRGHVRRSGDAVAVFAELSDIASAHVVWAHSFKGRADDLFAPDSELLRALVAGVASGVMVREAERAKAHPFPSLASPTLLFGAMGAMHRLAPADLEAAYAMLEQLMERNRRQPAPYAWLAHWHVLRARQGLTQDRAQEVRMARAQALAALEVDNQSPLALCIAGEVKAYLLHDLDGAESCYAQVLRARPDDPLALLLQAELHAFRDEGALAQRSAERALRLCVLQPLRFWHEQVAGLAALVAGDLGRALELVESAVARQPGFVASLGLLAVVQSASGQTEAARKTLRRLLHLRPDISLAQLHAECPACDSVAQRLGAALASAGAPLS